MFKSKIIVSVLLVGVVYNYLVMSALIMGVLMYLSGSEAWVVWAYPTALGIWTSIFVLVLIRRCKKKCSV